MPGMSGRLVPTLQAVAAGILFSTGGAVVKATELDAWQVAGSRSLIAAAALLIAVPAARCWAGGGASKSGPGPAMGAETGSAAGVGRGLRAARRRALLLTLGTGCCYCLTLVLFVHANKRTTAAETVFLQSTAPLFVLLLSPLLLGERARRREILLLPLFAAGLAMAFLGGADAAVTAPDPATGNLLATASGLAYGLTLIGLRAAGRSGRTVEGRGTARSASGPGAAPPGIAAAACGNVLVCVACLPVMTWPGMEALPELVPVAYLGLFQVALGYVFVTRAARTLEAPYLSLVLLLEPALSPFWALWLHGEQPHLLTWLGGGVILLAAALQAAAARSRA